MSTEVIQDVKIDEKIKKRTTEPKKYNVVMLNDDLTPMDWVIAVLKSIYKHSDAAAENLTMMIHTDGSAVVGTYAFEIAEQKASETIHASRSKGFPLTVKLDEA